MISSPILLLISLLFKTAFPSLPLRELVLRMPAEPNVSKENTEEEHCLCISVLLDPGKRYHIVDFSPLGAGENINHMALVSGVGFPSFCQEEDKEKITNGKQGNGLKGGKEIWDRESWRCSMGGGKAGETWQDLGSRTLYIWGRGAGGLELPEGTALAVGGREGERLVLQVHFKAGHQVGDEAAVRVNYRDEELGWGAGILSFHAGGMILPFRSLSILSLPLHCSALVSLLCDVHLSIVILQQNPPGGRLPIDWKAGE